MDSLSFLWAFRGEEKGHECRKHRENEDLQSPALTSKPEYAVAIMLAQRRRWGEDGRSSISTDLESALTNQSPGGGVLRGAAVKHRVGGGGGEEWGATRTRTSPCLCYHRLQAVLATCWKGHVVPLKLSFANTSKKIDKRHYR